MASTVPAKSQPLHNFNLPHLKWNKDGQSNGHHQRRRSVKSPLRRPNPSPVSPLHQSPLRDYASAPSPHRQSPLRESASPLALESSDKLAKQSKIGGGDSSSQASEEEWMRRPLMGSDSVKKLPIRGDSVRQSSKRELASESEALGRNKGCLIEYRRSHSRNPSRVSIKNGASASNSERTEEKSGKKQKVTDGGSTTVNKSKILIKIPPKNKSEEDSALEELRELDISDDRDETRVVVEDVKTSNNNDEEAKIWNLRPRKPVNKCVNMNGDGTRVITSVLSDKNKAHSPSRKLTNRSGEIEGNIGGGGENKVNKKLSVSIALTKEEIEEDIFSMTGSKPARRPKKRAKNIQKQVDFVFPGMWLVSITPDSYKVSENCLKG
ncbi:microtubule-associated protein futsch-like [Dorcoceras hygrometricum]|uniref:Microtubule-associated protein futsch-like n=1 Tax=Dorcoceras hygrometricum TaxID=472368 RepID=A0A2Z7CWK4_9LAMI|nr:microtubule-associated protein futsch-like [Dorcoceras hygrometricum]